MTIFFVTRHPGAREWAQRQGIEARQIKHLDIDDVIAGDVVMGTLPINIAAQIIERGARYRHLELELPEQKRGRDLTADEMENFGARLQDYFVKRID